MIFISAICIVLTLSSTMADQNATVERLMEEISTKVAVNLTQVAKAAVASQNGTVEVNDQVLSAMHEILENLEPQLNELKTLAGNSTGLAKDLARRIYQNNDLKAALSSGGKAQSRILAALFLGGTQILTDLLNVGLRPNNQ